MKKTIIALSFIMMVVMIAGTACAQPGYGPYQQQVIWPPPPPPPPTMFVNPHFQFWWGPNWRHHHRRHHHFHHRPRHHGPGHHHGPVLY